MRRKSYRVLNCLIRYLHLELKQFAFLDPFLGMMLPSDPLLNRLVAFALGYVIFELRGTAKIESRTSTARGVPELTALHEKAGNGIMECHCHGFLFC